MQASKTWRRPRRLDSTPPAAIATISATASAQPRARGCAAPGGTESAWLKSSVLQQRQQTRRSSRSRSTAAARRAAARVRPRVRGRRRPRRDARRPRSSRARRSSSPRAGPARSALGAGAQRPDGQRHRGVRPLGGAALLAVGGGAAGADVAQELLRRRGGRRLGERPPDVDAGVVVGAADRRCRRGSRCRRTPAAFSSLGARPVARLPDREELGQAAPVARGQRRLAPRRRDGRARGDLVALQILGAGLDVVVVRLQPVMVVGRDPVDRARARPAPRP